MERISNVAREVVKGLMGSDCFEQYELMNREGLMAHLKRSYTKNSHSCDDCGNDILQCDC